MRKSLIILSSALMVSMLSACKKGTKYTVDTDAQWNSAIENIVNVKKKNQLNYIATSDGLIAKASVLSKEHEITIQEIEVNDNTGVQRIEALYKGYSLDPFNYVFYKVNDNVYFQVNEWIDQGDTYSFKQNNPTQLFNSLLDIYDNKKEFTYNEQTKTYDCTYTPQDYETFKLSIGFENNVIKTLKFDYSMKKTLFYVPLVASLNGTLTFNYGTSSITRKKHINELNSRLCTINKSEDTILDGMFIKPIFLTINPQSTAVQNITFKGEKVEEDEEDYMYMFMNSYTNELIVFVDGQIQTMGEDKDYKLEEAHTTNTSYYKKLTFNTPVANKKIELCINSVLPRGDCGNLSEFQKGPYKVILN